MKTAWRVRWDAGSNGHRRQESKTFDRLDDAKAFAAHVERQSQLGELAPMLLGAVALADFLPTWLERHALRIPYAPNTLDGYERTFRLHVNPTLGHVALRDLTVPMVEDLDARLARQNVSDHRRHRVLTDLGAVLDCAVRWGFLNRNVARLARKPEVRRGKPKRDAFTALQVEHARRHVLTRPVAPGNEHHRLMDAALVSLLAFAGLRSGEAWALTWADLGDQCVHVRHALRDGKRVGTKTGRTRTVRLIEPVTEDLRAWRQACPSSAPSAPVFPAASGRFTTKTAQQNWAKRVFHPAAVAAGKPTASPLSLRHTFVSLLIQSGRVVTDVAAQAGHSVKVCFDHYAHEFEEFDLARRRPLVEQVREARETVAVTKA